MIEVSPNKWRASQLALRWLKEAKEPVDEDMSYLAQLAFWGLENEAQVPGPMAPNWPLSSSLVEQVHLLLGAGKKANRANHWFLSNPNLSFEEQARNLEFVLQEAKDLLEAAEAVIETAYGRMIAASVTYPD